MADKTGLELIGAMLCAATVFVVAVAGYVVHVNVALQEQTGEAVQVAQLPAAPSQAQAIAVSLRGRR